MGAIIIIAVIAVIEAAAIAAGIFLLISRQKGGGGSETTKIQGEVESRKQILNEIEQSVGELVEVGSVRGTVREILALQEALRAERGRITITQAELDTVEGRLRELEEIERELEASGIETQEELKILNKKEKELKAKNDALQQQIALSIQQIEKLMGEIEVSAQVQEQVYAMKTELLQTEQQIATLLMQIEGGNEQYFIMKRRYDALDIEYAQLYEKFSEIEAAAKPA